MFRQESGRFGVDQNAGPDVGSSEDDSRSDGQAQGQGGIVDAAKDKIEQLASQARETASKQVESRFSTGKTRAAHTLGSVAQTLKASSHQLREQHEDAVSKYADQAAQKLEEITHYLENASLNDVRARVEDFGRREPALFIGSAVALGFLGARFLRSSQRKEGEMRMRQGFQESAQQRDQQEGGAEQRSQGASDSWQGTGDRDVTPAPQREWTTVGSERQSNPNENTADRTGRA